MSQILILVRRAIIEGKSASKILIFLAAAFACMFAAHQVRSEPEFAGRAEILTGTVTIERASGRDIMKIGDPVFTQDRIFTGEDSSVEIVFIDQSRMKLAADTSLEITGYVYNPSEKIRHGLISLIFGKVRFVVLDLQEFNDRRFRVQTGTALVGSRDTDFIVSHDRELPRDEVCRGGLVTALCLKNSIIVSSTGFEDKFTLLSDNMISQVCGPNLPTPPRFATAAELTRTLVGLDQIGNTKVRQPGPTGNSADCTPQ